MPTVKESIKYTYLETGTLSIVVTHLSFTTNTNMKTILLIISSLLASAAVIDLKSLGKSTKSAL
jgi:hypothetical protein